MYFPSNFLLKKLIISKSILGELSNKLSYSALITFKKSLQGFLLLSCKDNSISIVRLSLDQARADIRCPSYISAYLRNANKVPKIPQKILRPPTQALNPCLAPSGTYESVAKLAVPVKVDKTIIGICR